MQTSRTNFCCHYESRTVRKGVDVVDHEENVESEYLLTNIGRDIRASQVYYPKQEAKNKKLAPSESENPGNRIRGIWGEALWQGTVLCIQIFAR